MLVDSIRTATGKPLKNLKSAPTNNRNELERRTTDLIFGAV
ncbi:unnamed protein product, partial [Rotaria magnacalcarata]